MASRACREYLSMLADISTLLKSIALIVLTISLRLGDPAIATDSNMPMDQEINVPTDRPNNYVNLNGTTFELMELDILCRASCWETYRTEDGSRLRHKRSKASLKRFLLWNDGKVPYTLDATFSANDKKNLLRAMDEYKKYTCIEFHEASSSHTDYIRIDEAAACSSELGRQQGATRLSLAKQCRKIPIMLHELGHAIGLMHEHSRPDRDDYIRINRSNIRPEYINDFEKLDWDESYNSSIEYDYRSIMHYRDNEASRDGTKREITTNDHRYQNIIGRQEGLSFRDVKLINMLYNCSKRNGCPEISCRGEGFVGQDCNCWCPSADISTSSVHCNESNALVNVGDILKKERNVSNNAEEPELRSTEEKNETVQLPSYHILPSKLLLYIKGEGSGYEKLSLLMLLVEFLSKYTCRQFLVEMHIDDNRKILDANGISAYLKSDDGDMYRSWAKSCITMAQGGFITKRRMTSAEELGTVDCVNSYETVSDSNLLVFKSVVFWWTHFDGYTTYSESSIGLWIIGTIGAFLIMNFLAVDRNHVFFSETMYDHADNLLRRVRSDNGASNVMVQAATSEPAATVTPAAKMAAPTATAAPAAPAVPGTKAAPAATNEINNKEARITLISFAKWIAYIFLITAIIWIVAAPLLIICGRYLFIFMCSLLVLGVISGVIIKVTDGGPLINDEGELLESSLLRLAMFGITLLRHRRDHPNYFLNRMRLHDVGILLCITGSFVVYFIMCSLYHRQSNVVTQYWAYQNLTSVRPDRLHNGIPEVNASSGCADQSGCSLLVPCPVGLLAEDCQYWCPPEDTSHAAIFTGDQWINQLLSTFVTQALFDI